MVMKSPTLRYNGKEGKGSVVTTPSFHEESALFRADLLGDWIRDLEDLYEDAIAELYGDETLTTESREEHINKLVDDFVKSLKTKEQMVKWIRERARSDFTSWGDRTIVSVAKDYKK